MFLKNPALVYFMDVVTIKDMRPDEALRMPIESKMPKEYANLPQNQTYSYTNNEKERAVETIVWSFLPLVQISFFNPTNRLVYSRTKSDRLLGQHLVLLSSGWVPFQLILDLQILLRYQDSTTFKVINLIVKPFTIKSYLQFMSPVFMAHSC